MILDLDDSCLPLLKLQHSFTDPSVLSLSSHLSVHSFARLFTKRSPRSPGVGFPLSIRDALGIRGLIPPTVETLSTQMIRIMHQFRSRSTDLERHLYLRTLKNSNTHLFYRAVVSASDDAEERGKEEADAALAFLLLAALVELAAGSYRTFYAPRSGLPRRAKRPSSEERESS